MSFAFKKSDSPPSSRTPTSKETRVRVDDLAKSNAHTWLASGLCWLSPRPPLNTLEFSRIVSISFRESVSKLSRCFIGCSPAESGRQPLNDRFEDANAFLSLVSAQVQWRQQANDL